MEDLLTEEQKEREANAFALAILMPKEMFLKELMKMKSMEDDLIIKKLAKKFQVPKTAVVLRITMLGKVILD